LIEDFIDNDIIDSDESVETIDVINVEL